MVFTSSYWAHTFSRPAVFLIELRITHHLHALELAESNDALKHIMEHHKSGLRKGLGSDIRNFKSRANGTKLDHLVWVKLAQMTNMNQVWENRSCADTWIPYRTVSCRMVAIHKALCSASKFCLDLGQAPDSESAFGGYTYRGSLRSAWRYAATQSNALSCRRCRLVRASCSLIIVHVGTWAYASIRL